MTSRWRTVSLLTSYALAGSGTQVIRRWMLRPSMR